MHTAGQYVVLSVAELGSYPHGLNGSIVVLDFGGRGLGGPGELAAATPDPVPAPEQQEQEQRGGRQRRGGSAASKQRKDDKEEEEEEGKHSKSRRRAKPNKRQGGSRAKGKAPATQAATDDEAGPSRKRGKR